MSVSRAFEEILELASARRDLLLRELDVINAFIRDCRSFQDNDARILSEPLWTKLQEIHGQSVIYPANAAIVETVLKILRRTGRPMSRKEIHRQLLAAGIHVPGEDPAKHLGTILWRADSVESINRRYWFTGEERPANAD